MIDIETFIKKTYGLFQREDYTTTELKKLPAKGISVPSSIWGCYVEGSKPKKFSIKTLAERSNVDWNNILSTPHTDYLHVVKSIPLSPEPSRLFLYLKAGTIAQLISSSFLNI